MTDTTALPTRLAALLALAALICTTPALSQDRGGDREESERPGQREQDGDNSSEEDNDRRGGDKERDTDRRSGWELPDDATSANNEQLKRMLERFPDSDTDKNGVLNAEEARAFVEKWREERRKRMEQWRQGRGRDRVRPTHNDIPYGPHPSHVIDLYLAESEEPTPLVVFFHGGQFITGDKSQLGTLQVKELLEAGISVASVDYRDVNELPFPAPFEDAARAVQFLRFFAAQINVDPTRIVGHGEEAGGNLALYLGLHDDLAKRRSEIPELAIRDTDPDNASRGEEVELPSILPQKTEDGEEPEGDEDADLDSLLLGGPQPWEMPEIATASTRLACVVARHPIASFDPRSWERTRMPMNRHERLMCKYLDVRFLEPLDNEDVIALVEQVSPLALVSSDDPEVLLMSQYTDLELQDNTNWTIVRHHPKQSQLIATALRGKGVKATVRYKDMPNDPGTSSVDFFVQKLK